MANNTVNTPSSAYYFMAQNWAIVDALMGGTRAMREAGEMLLPKFVFEEKDSYKNRLGASVLLPVYSETIKAMGGRVFRKTIRIDEKTTPPTVLEFTKEANKSKDSLSVIASEWLSDALAYGISHMLIDFPQNNANGVLTKQDERDLKLRPFASVIKHNQVIGWRQKDGELTQLRIREFVSEDDGAFGSKEIEQIRVFEPGVCKIYRHDAAKVEFELYLEIPMTLRRIPVVTLYAKRTGFMMAEPPLMGLAHLNVAHWQSASDQRNILHVARVPILAVTGMDGDGDLKIGSASAVQLPRDATMKYVEHTGAAIAAGADDLRALEDQMRQCGAKMLQADQPVRITATQSVEDKARALSPLAQIAQALEDGLNNVLQLCADWLGEKTGGRAEITADFDIDAAPDNSMSTLISMQQTGNLSKATLFDEAKRRGIIQENIQWQDEIKQIEDDGAPLGLA